jgi:hypothetical protein
MESLSPAGPVIADVRQLCEGSIVNEPMPLQLTVGQLRQALQIAPDEAIVGSQVPARLSRFDPAQTPPASEPH